MSEPLRLVVRTPHDLVFDGAVRSARLPAESGWFGLRARGEAFATVVEPGLVVLRADGPIRFVATAGGLLDAGQEQAVLYTPFAVAGVAEADVLSALDRALGAPDAEITARRRLGELERRILQELRRGTRAPRAGDGDG